MKVKYFVDALYRILQRLANVSGEEHQTPTLTNETSWPTRTAAFYRTPANSGQV